MKLHHELPTLDGILERRRASLGGDFAAYRNHCYRVLNFCLALCGERALALEKTAVAAAFHDLAIWTHGTFDYLAPSRQLAREYLVQTGQDLWAEEIEAMIEQHHKLTTYRSNPDWLVEPFRRADWLDLSKGSLRFGLPVSDVQAVLSAFPNAGFHRRLVAMIWRRATTHPFSPLPMMRL